MNSDHANLSKDEGDAPRFLESKPLKAKKAAPAQKKQWILLGVLSLFFVFLVIQTLAGGKKKPPLPAVKETIPAAAVTMSAARVTPENDIFQAPSLDKEPRSSPFARVSSGTPGGPAPIQASSSLILQGVLSDASGSVYAVINEKIVKKGERMADKVVTTIQSDSVILRSDNGEEMTLRMKTS